MLWPTWLTANRPLAVAGTMPDPYQLTAMCDVSTIRSTGLEKHMNVAERRRGHGKLFAGPSIMNVDYYYSVVQIGYEKAITGKVNVLPEDAMTLLNWFTAQAKLTLQLDDDLGLTIYLERPDGSFQGTGAPFQMAAETTPK
jgi:hypothetical protein